MLGQTLGHYRIVREIGAGGMGVVYEAEDTTLDRYVALKLLPPELAADDQRRQRFAREARALAALNHPNIVTVHSVEQSDGVHFITMELVKGTTLADLLSLQGLSLSRFFEIAIPLTDAVAAAHLHGIAHRDLKPSNVMVGEDGRIKMLDFGLAKALSEAGPAIADQSTLSATRAGVVVGTPAYMSPEQAQGAAIDSRSDIFSLGVVFYEMLTGRRPFEGDSPASVVSAILRDKPRPISELQPSVPRVLVRLVDRCLAKNPTDRFQSALDLRHTLEEARQDVDSGDAFIGQRSVPLPPRPMQPRFAALAALAVLVLGAAALWRGLDGGDSGEPAIPQLRNPLQVTSALAFESYPTWSPDGQRVAYQANEDGFIPVGNHDIWVAQPGSGEPVNLTRDSPANDRRPSWSPDGREIAFFSDRDREWGLYVMPAIGGTPRKLLALPGMVPTHWTAPQWSADGSRLYVVTQESGVDVVIVLTADSLETTKIALPRHDSPRHWDLSVRPDGKRFAYVEAGGGGPELSRLWTCDVSGREPVPLTDGRTNVWSPTWSNDGRRIFFTSNRGGSMDLWQQGVAEDGQPTGEPIALTTGLGIRSAMFSPDSTRLAYSRGGRIANVWRLPILPDRSSTWADAKRLTSDRAYIEFVDVSPDGEQLAISSDRRGNQDLWVLPATGGELTPLTTDPTPDWQPRWSPDGTQLAFYSYRSGNRDIWTMPARGGPARQITSHPAFDWFPTWSPDGQEITFDSQRESPSVWVVPATGGEARRLASGNGHDWSPDGKWLVVVGSDTIRRFSREGTDLGQLSVGSHRPNVARVSRDGRSIFYSVVQGPPDHLGLWRLSLADGAISPLVNLQGQRGRLGYYFAADARYLYITWNEDDSDIWVMDVAPSGNARAR